MDHLNITAGRIKVDTAGITTKTSKLSAAFVELTNPTAFDVEEIRVLNISDYTNDQTCSGETVKCGVCIERVHREQSNIASVVFDHERECKLLIDLDKGRSNLTIHNLTTTPGKKISKMIVGGTNAEVCDAPPCPHDLAA